jgi:hypothetical protein
MLAVQTPGDEVACVVDPYAVVRPYWMPILVAVPFDPASVIWPERSADIWPMDDAALDVTVGSSQSEVENVVSVDVPVPFAFVDDAAR